MVLFSLVAVLLLFFAAKVGVFFILPKEMVACFFFITSVFFKIKMLFYSLSEVLVFVFGFKLN